MATFDLPKHYHAVSVEDKWYAEWEKSGCFNSDVDPTRTPYTIVIPPPNVTGILHMGHALNNTLQDILIRVERMRGKNALWQPGTDHAGIATQNVVERQLKKDGHHRDELGRQLFIEHVWRWKAEYGSAIINQLKKLGSSCDWRRERFTMDDGLSNAVRNVFVRLYNEGLIYRGRRLINWCPKDRTALADDEVEHSEENGNLWQIRYTVKNSPRHIVVATTRPETMLGDVAVAVHPDDERYQDLIGQVVILPILEREIPIIADTFVDPQFGTGCVKVTPAHDANDYECGLRHQLQQIIVIGEDGMMTENAGKYSGLDRFRCREKIVEELTEKKILEKIDAHTHQVGHCYRCNTIIEPYLSEQWFVKMQPLAQRAMKATENGEVKFYPPRWERIYLSWLENVRDWCISRQIWWGHRIPVWYCDQCDEVIVVETEPERCPKCNSKHLRQDEDVLDTWFSSALWPFSTLGFPEKTADLAYYYPTDTLVTDRGIIYFWVARMVMMGLHFMEKVPFRTVYIHGTILDEHGAKMSKSKGNGIDPLVMIQGGAQTRFGKEMNFEPLGADALRYTLCALTTEGQDVKLSPTRFEMGRNFINKVWNASRFVLMNLWEMKLSNDDVKIYEMSFADRWIISRLHGLIEQLDKAFENFAFSEYSTLLYDFIWRDYCDWYVEMVKPDLKNNDRRADISGRVLLLVLDNILRVLHPITPFFTEEVWSILASYAPIRGLSSSTPPAEKYLMLAKFPTAENELRAPEFEAAMLSVQEIVRAVRNIRAKFNAPANITVPLSIKAVDESYISKIKNCLDIIRSQAGVGEITLSMDLQKPAVSAAEVLTQAQIFVPLSGFMDVEIEKKRVVKDLENKEKSLHSLNLKLHNVGFLSGAPAEVVVAEKTRRGELIRQITELQELRDGLN